MKKREEMKWKKKWEKKKDLSYCSNKVRTIQTSREKMVKSFSSRDKKNWLVEEKKKRPGLSKRTDMAAASIFDEGRSRTSER